MNAQNACTVTYMFFAFKKGCLGIKMCAYGRRWENVLQSLAILHFFPPIHRGPKKEHAQWHFETFCATWWNFPERELSGV